MPESDGVQPVGPESGCLPSPLDVPSDQFVRAHAQGLRIGRLGSAPGALEVYRRFFREGPGVLSSCNLGEVLARAGRPLALPRVTQVLRQPSPEGPVVKFLTSMPRVAAGAQPQTGGAAELADVAVESVLIPMMGTNRLRRYTLCVSSQVGCAMGCTFCETAQMGLIRSLTSAEIVGQWFAARHLVDRGELDAFDPPAPPAPPGREATVRGFEVSNIVFMGMGEPLDNYDNVVRAIATLKDHNGPHVPISRITVSTVGRVDGIRKLAAQIHEVGWRRLGIALSLNAPNDADRSAIMPINRKWNLGEVQRALLEWPVFAGNKVCVEYVLIPGVNDTPQHADQIAEFIRPFGLHRAARGAETNLGLRAVLNLIPYNPRRNSPWPAPEEAQVAQFMGWLEERGVFVKRRRTKGRDMMGACGQLGSAHVRKRRFVDLTSSVSPV